MRSTSRRRNVSLHHDFLARGGVAKAKLVASQEGELVAVRRRDLLEGEDGVSDGDVGEGHKRDGVGLRHLHHLVRARDDGHGVRDARVPVGHVHGRREGHVVGQGAHDKPNVTHERRRHDDGPWVVEPRRRVLGERVHVGHHLPRRPGDGAGDGELVERALDRHVRDPHSLAQRPAGHAWRAHVAEQRNEGHHAVGRRPRDEEVR
mmetsp:Transcript_175/g.460  ORF Transcript_175/g.460 Transcript_175/m.460 type:complete len:205 (+) Transcript_175:1703-2317(+)